MNKPLHYWNRNWIPLTTSFIITGTYVFSCANSFLQCLLLNTPIFIHKDMTITRMSEMFAFNLALYKYWSLPQLGSLLNFIFSHYLHVPVPRYLLSFNISIKYKVYKEEHNMILHLYISLFTRFFYTYSASPWDLTHFKNLAVPRHSILTADNWRPPCEWEKFCESSILSSTAKMTHKVWMSHVCTNIIIFNIHSCRQTIKNDLTVSCKAVW